MNKKGVGFGDMLPLVITFIVSGIGIIIGAYMISEIKTQAGFGNTTSGYNATVKVEKGITTFANMMPIIAIALVFAIIISIIIGFLVIGRGRR